MGDAYSNIKIYPNLTKNDFHIDFLEVEISESKIIVFDINGKEVVIKTIKIKIIFCKNQV